MSLGRSVPVIFDLDDHALAHQVDSLDPADGGPGNDELLSLNSPPDRSGKRPLLRRRYH